MPVASLAAAGAAAEPVPALRGLKQGAHIDEAAVVARLQNPSPP